MVSDSHYIISSVPLKYTKPWGRTMIITRIGLVVLLAATVVLALCGMAFAGGEHIQTITSQVQPYAEIQVIDGEIAAHNIGATPKLSDDKALIRVSSDSFSLVRIIPDGYIRTRSNGVMARAISNQEAIGYEVMVRSPYGPYGFKSNAGYRPYWHPYLVVPFITREFSIGARVAGNYTADGSYAPPGSYVGKLIIIASVF